ncbi:hypothetical protein [Saccharicrinis aurantiacus]|uniref:hypothetical protein n=1 Tax=Saccharicrinis aurantiacus TaxID=1849719 RepID=UPI00094FC610|nr:hypothetical protein [Saccharicrinis aurantiacus]
MNTNFDIKPLSHDEKQRIESGIAFDELSITFFILLPIVLIGSLIYASYQSKSLIFAIFTIVVIIGSCLYFIPLLKGFVINIKESKIALERNEKQCANGYIQKKWFERQPAYHRTFYYFYIMIDDVEYEISQDKYDELNSDDYVYYEVMHPLYCEVKKI